MDRHYRELRPAVGLDWNATGLLYSAVEVPEGTADKESQRMTVEGAMRVARVARTAMSGD